jgi:hypothetical protein
MKQCQAPRCNNSIFSHGYCVYHQNQRTDDKYISAQEKKMEKQKWTQGFKIIKKSIKTKPKEDTGQTETFEEIWLTREHKSWLTGDNLRQYEDKMDDNQCWIKHPLWFNLFHHVLPKKNYKKFLTLKDNIILLLPQEHLSIHSLSRDKLIVKYGEDNMNKYYDLVETLKERYKNK